MATLAKRKFKAGDSFCVAFYLNGERRYMNLGMKYTKSDAEEVRRYVEKTARLIESGGEPDRKTEIWLDSMTDDLRERFVRAGLIEAPKTATLGKLFDLFLDSPSERQEATLLTYAVVQKRFFRYFDPNADPNDLTKSDCLEWLDALESEYAEATIATTVKRCRTVFGWAIQEGYIEVNPFTGITGYSYQNKENERYITADQYRKVLDACPDQTWRTLLSLCRYGGLRNPSETLRVKWSDVNWETGKMLVHSPKTKRYAGKDTRVIPLFPEMRVELEKQFEQAEPGGSPFVIDRWRDTSKNMRTRFQQIIFLAGLEEWPRLFHNLRGSRSNELFSAYPAHVASNWMGQSERVALRHYLHPTDADFQRATAGAGVDEENGIEGVETLKDGIKYRSTVDAKFRVH